MRIKIVGIYDRGVPGKERLHLQALTDLNLVNFVIFDTVKEGLGIRPMPKNALWFSSNPIRGGENVIVYTGPGGYTKEVKSAGTYHFFHWGAKTTLWLEPNSCAVVLEVLDWTTSP